MTTTLRVLFDGNVLVPEQPVDLPVGRSMEVRIEPASEPAVCGPGNAAAILALMRSLPPVPEEDVAELERLIEESKLPPTDGISFDE